MAAGRDGAGSVPALVGLVACTTGISAMAAFAMAQAVGHAPCPREAQHTRDRWYFVVLFGESRRQLQRFALRLIVGATEPNQCSRVVQRAHHPTR
jgi:hypothetical protein